MWRWRTYYPKLPARLRRWRRAAILLSAGVVLFAAFWSYVWWNNAATVAGIRDHGVLTHAKVTSVVADCATGPCNYSLDIVYEVGGKEIHSTVSPNDVPNNLTPGQLVNIIYNSQNVSSAFYAGPGGDAYGGSSPAIFGTIAVICAFLLLVVVMKSVDRWRSLLRAGSSFAGVGPKISPMPLRIERHIRRERDSLHTYHTVTAERAYLGHDLSWRLMEHQDVPDGHHTAGIAGHVVPGGLVVTRLRPGSELLWPATRAVTYSRVRNPAPLAALKEGHAELLSAYAGALMAADADYRPIVRLMVRSHISTRLRQLRVSYLRTRAWIAVCGTEQEFISWSEEAARDCDALNASLATASVAGRILGYLNNMLAVIGVLVTLGLPLSLKSVFHRGAGAALVVASFAAVLVVWVIGIWYSSQFNVKRKILVGDESAVKQRSDQSAPAPVAELANCYKAESMLYSFLGQAKPIEQQTDVRLRNILGLTLTLAWLAAFAYDGFRTGTLQEWIFDGSVMLLITVLTLHFRWRRREKVLMREWR
jgi:hypothetical protein